MCKRKRTASTDHLFDDVASEPTETEMKKQARLDKMPLGSRGPVAAADAPKPKLQGRDAPVPPVDHRQRRGNLVPSGTNQSNRSPTRTWKNSRDFEKDQNDKQAMNQHHQSSPSTPASVTQDSPTGSAVKLKSPLRSTSYTTPLPLFAEESKPRSGHGAGAGPAPLTEQNLRNLLRSLDTGRDTDSSPPVPAALPNSIPKPRPKPHGDSHGRAEAVPGFVFFPGTSASGAGSLRASDIPTSAHRSSAPHVTAVTGANSSSMRKSKSPKKHDKDKERKKSKHNPDSDTHPLNLPPEQLRQHLAHMARQEAEANRQPMPMDRDSPETSNDLTMANDTSPPATPSRDAPAAFPTQTDNETTNGTNGHDERSPTPPPHKVQPVPKVDPEAYKAAGNKFFKAKDYEKAIAEYTKAVDAEPSNPTYLSNRAAAYISANKYSQALGDSLQASRLDPNNDKILHRLARIYTSLGRPQDALDTYAKIPNASATDTAAARKALQSIAVAETQINAEDGNGNMALWSLEQAKQTLGADTPTPRQWQILKAKANLKIGSANALGEVQGIAQNLMRENSMDAEAIVLAGRAFYLRDEKPRQGKSDYDRAEDYFRQALSLDPDNADARNFLRTMKKLERAKTSANDMFKKGKFSNAVEAYTEALTIDPANKVTNAKLLGNRALARIKIKEFDEAKTDCDQALKLDPTYSKARKTRAKATGESGDWEQAVKDLKAMVEENPSDAEMNKELRNAELELKKSKRKDYYKILGIDKDAGDKEIERAYKRKAAILHPDKTMGDKAKEEEFKDCLEAKETLLDPQKRHMYDSGADLMEPGMGMGGGFPGGMGGFGGMGGMGGMGGGGGGVQIDPEMLFNMMNGMGGGGGAGGGGFRFSTAGGRGGYPFG